MKKIFVFLIGYFLLLFTHAQSLKEKWVVNNSSQLSINGKSNINVFECNYEKAFQNSEVLVVDSLGSLFFTDSIIIFEVESFNCDHARMTADFQRTMQVAKFPFLKMEILSLTKTDNNFTLNTQLTVAGEVRKQLIVLLSGNLSKDEMNLVGSHKIKMSDFGLNPPTVLWGMIKVTDEIVIDFSFFLVRK